MGFMLVIAVMFAGNHYFAAAIPQVSAAMCEKTAAQVRMMSNFPVEGKEYECITREEFLKRIGERET